MSKKDEREMSARDLNILKHLHAGRTFSEVRDLLELRSTGVVSGVKFRLWDKYVEMLKENDGLVETPEYAPEKNDNNSSQTHSETVEEEHSEPRASIQSNRRLSQYVEIKARIRTDKVIETIREREDRDIFKPEIREGMTAKEIMEEYDRFKALSRKPKTEQHSSAAEENEDSAFEK